MRVTLMMKNKEGVEMGLGWMLMMEGDSNGQNLTHTGMMTHVQTSEEFLQDITPLKVHPDASATSGLPIASFYPKDIPEPESHSAITRDVSL